MTKIIEIKKYRENQNNVVLTLLITNNTDFTWNSSNTKGGVNLVTIWDFQKSDSAKRDYIFRNFLPGESKIFEIALEKPETGGNYTIEIDLVKEEEFWFSQLFDSKLKYSVKTGDYISGQQLFESLCMEFTKSLPTEYPIIDKKSKKKSLLVENRNLIHNEFVIKNTIQKLGDGWGHIIYCHKNNFDQIKAICSEISTEIEIRLLDFELSRSSYNNLLLNPNFWKEIDCEKVLIYQTDTFISKKFDDSFLEYDYVGGNWSDEHENYLKKLIKKDISLRIGNGGLSIRDVKKTRDCLKNTEFKKKYLTLKLKGDEDLEKTPEDTFFSIYFSDKNLPTLEKNSQFSNETDYQPDSFGIHKPWNLIKDLEIELKYLFYNSTEIKKIEKTYNKKNNITNMEKYSIFHIEGGFGKHIAATAVAKAIKYNHPDRKLIIVCAWPEIFINLPCVWRVYRVGSTPYFWENYIKDGNSIIFKHEPYFTTEHINGEMSLIENWCKLYNLEWYGEGPEINFNRVQEQTYYSKWLREKPIFVIQTNGGPLNDQPHPYSWARDIPYALAQTIVDQVKETHHVIQVCRNNLNVLRDVEVQNQPMSNLDLVYLLKMADKRLLIDSCLQHAAAALNLPSTVLWIATNPKLFGYELHYNISANIRNEIPMPDSYLFDYNFHGQLWECPIQQNDVIFDENEILMSLNRL